MSMQILHLYDPTPEPPFLSAQAAANHWLAGALRALDHEVVARPIAGTPPETLNEVSSHFDVVHVLGELPAGATLSAPAVQTQWRTAASALPHVALSWRQARSLPTPPVVVAPPAIPIDDVETPTERGDHFVSVFDPAGEAALAAAVRVARSAERELIVLTSGEDRPDDGDDPLMSFVPVRPDRIPPELLSAAAYLSFSSAPSDVACVTAMAAGVSVITLDGLAAAETIVSGESGYVCANVEEAARAAERLELLSPKLGRARARALFDLGPWAERLAETYAAVAAGQRRAFRHPEQLAAVG
jgi:glycosyltransferase involved in cell wall biosynthesis